MDCLEFLNLMSDNSADLVFADPPFNTNKDYGELVNDNISDDDYYLWSNKWLSECFRILKPTGSIYVYINSRRLGRLQTMMSNYGCWQNTIVWHYTNPTPDQKRYPKTWSAFLFYTKSEKGYYFNKDSTQVPSFHTNLKFIDNRKVRLYDVWWNVSKLVSGTVAQREVIKENGTRRMYFPRQLPKELLRRIILSSSRENDLVIDPFMHSGTTAVVALELGRNFIGCDINQEYVDRANQRVIKSRIGEQLALFS